MPALPTRAERASLGDEARRKVPLAAHASWAAAPDRPDPVALLEQQAATRIPSLVPVRHGRMAASPFAFYRGAALPMAADLATTPSSGITVQLCGDAHLSNFGLFASPERDLLFDVTDFDETLPGPFEWDVKRLAASFVVAGRGRGFPEAAGHHAAVAAVRSYRERMAEYAAMPALDVYYTRVDTAAIIAFVDKRARPYLQGTVKSATHHDALHELPKLTSVDATGRRRIMDHPPTITHPADLTMPLVGAVLTAYRATIREDRQALFDRYELVDGALKVVGVGSVGLGAYAALFLDDAGNPLFLQAKEAEASVLERFLGPSTHATHGERVVAGQRRLQAASDIFLGWAVGTAGRHWYVRQLQDQKGVAVVDAMGPDDLATWGQLCGWTLARGHARSGEPATIAAYLGAEHEFDHAIAAFAAAYADQAERDYDAFVAAIKAGRVAAEPGT
jgi:uncharacterized protein (DUF2252 family)